MGEDVRGKLVVPKLSVCIRDGREEPREMDETEGGAEKEQVIQLAEWMLRCSKGAPFQSPNTSPTVLKNSKFNLTV